MNNENNRLLDIIDRLQKENNELKLSINSKSQLIFNRSLLKSNKILKNKINVSVNNIIEGDNYDVLNQLSTIYKDKIDMIYIDPPYNTRKSDFKYKDNMLHKDWLEFMYARLFIAKNLMSDKATIFISIDDNEFAHLKLLCDELFGFDNFVANFIWKKSHTVKNDKKNISIQHEYILCYAKNKQNLNFNKERVGQSYIKQAYRLKDEKGIFRTVPLHKKKNPNTYTVIAPSGKEWTLAWNYNKAGFDKLIKENMVYWGRNGNSCPNKKVYLKENMLKTYGTMLNPEKVKYTGSGGLALESLGFEKTDFIYAKPVELIAHFIEIATSKDSFVLDFFAGSGTTGEAVMKVNMNDNGNRKFILINSNENNICKEITYQRNIRAAKKYNYSVPIEFNYII